LINNKHIDPAAFDNQAIMLAWKLKHYDIVAYLWSQEEIKCTLEKNSEELYNLLVEASGKEKHEAVLKKINNKKSIYKFVKSTENTNLFSVLKENYNDFYYYNWSNDEKNILELVAEFGEVSFMTFLLESTKADPSKNNNWAISIAAKNGHLEIVKLLLKDERVDPTINNYLPFYLALENNHFDIIELFSTSINFQDSLLNLDFSNELNTLDFYNPKNYQLLKYFPNLYYIPAIPENVKIDCMLKNKQQKINLESLFYFSLKNEDYKLIIFLIKEKNFFNKKALIKVLDMGLKDILSVMLENDNYLSYLCEEKSYKELVIIKKSTDHPLIQNNKNYQMYPKHTLIIDEIY
jgi:hypothetical protein